VRLSVPTLSTIYIARDQPPRVSSVRFLSQDRFLDCASAGVCQQRVPNAGLIF